MISIIHLSCSQTEMSEEEIYKIVQNHYDEDPFFDKPKIKIKLIKDLDSEYKAVIVNIENEKYAYGFVNKSLKKYSPFQELYEKKDKITHASSWGIQLIKTINGQTNKEQVYSIFLGIIPYEGYSKIEMSWNCKQTETIELIDRKYFMFTYPKGNMRRCNTIYLINDKGEKSKIEYKNGKFALN